MQGDRREFLRSSIRGLFLTTLGLPLRAAADDAPMERSAEQWMKEWMDVKLPVGTLHLSRFRDPIYFLIKQVSWRPNPGQEAHPRVDVPVGFVTDFASIPRIFWSLLRPDGEYTYAAIVHDYLYWTQTRPRDVADLIFKFGMEDFRVSSNTVSLVYDAVRLGGGSAWDNNTRLRTQGEKRILKRFPDDPRVSWDDWKRVPDVFVTDP